MFSDLECDYINPIDLCNKLNQVRGRWTTRRADVLTPLPVCVARKRTARVPHPPFLTFWTMDGFHSQLALGHIQRQQVSR